MRKRLTRLAVVVGMAIALASGGLALTVITAFAGNMANSWKRTALTARSFT